MTGSLVPDASSDREGSALLLTQFAETLNLQTGQTGHLDTTPYRVCPG